MTEVIYLITHGPYYEYGVIEILTGPQGMNVGRLWEDFCEENGFDPDGYGVRTTLEDWVLDDSSPPQDQKQAQLSRDFGLSTEKELPSGTWVEHASIARIFTAWLIKNHGFEKPGHIEANIYYRDE